MSGNKGRCSGVWTWPVTVVDSINNKRKDRTLSVRASLVPDNTAWIAAATTTKDQVHRVQIIGSPYTGEDLHIGIVEIIKSRVRSETDPRHPLYGRHIRLCDLVHLMVNITDDEIATIIARGINPATADTSPPEEDL